MSATKEFKDYSKYAKYKDCFFMDVYINHMYYPDFELCLLCGKLLEYHHGLHHLNVVHPEWTKSHWKHLPSKRHHCYIKKLPIKESNGWKSKFKDAPVKPWEDSESLFCDTKFLTGILGKKPLISDECKD